MKPVFKCDYCSFMGTEDEVKRHELRCYQNYNRRSCYTCEHAKLKSYTQYSCAQGRDIPERQIFEFCNKYVRSFDPEYPPINVFTGILR